MIMFFEIKKFFFLNFLTWSFMEELNYITPIIIDKHKYQAIYFKILLKEIFTFFKVDLVFLDKNPHYIDKTLNPMHLYNNKKSDKILTIDLKNTSWVKYYEGISSSKTRQTDRRKEKLLSKLGNVEIFIANTALEKEKILNFTIKNKVSYLKKKKLTTKNFNNLYVKLFNDIKNDPRYICSALKLNNKIISSIIGRIDKKNYYYLIPSYLEKDFVKYSPGRILLKKQIKWCFENNIDLFDFGPGEFEYKKQWANDFKYYFKILEPKSFLGLIYYICYKIKKVLY